jgi:hypothetical protein
MTKYFLTFLKLISSLYAHDLQNVQYDVIHEQIYDYLMRHQKQVPR